MPTTRAIDKLKQAFSIEERSSYSIFKGDELILKVFWSPLTIADRDTINNTLSAMNKGQEEGNLDFALQVIITKAEDEAGVLRYTIAAANIRQYRERFDGRDNKCHGCSMVSKASSRHRRFTWMGSSP